MFFYCLFSRAKQYIYSRGGIVSSSTLRKGALLIKTVHKRSTITPSFEVSPCKDLSRSDYHMWLCCFVWHSWDIMSKIWIQEVWTQHGLWIRQDTLIIKMASNVVISLAMRMVIGKFYTANYSWPEPSQGNCGTFILFTLPQGLA
jgi:hypothetical protein